MGFVAVFIDWENIEATVKKNGSILEYESFIESIKKTAKNYGCLSNIFAYGDFDKIPGLQTKLFNLGVESKHVVTKTANKYLKGSTDIEFSLDILEILFDYPHITDYLLVSGDGDLRYILKRLRMRGKVLHLMGFKNNTNNFIINMVEDFVALDDFSIMRKITKTEIEKKNLILINDEYVIKLIQDLNFMENQNTRDFIGLNYFRKRLIEKYPATLISEALTDALDYEILDTYKVPNPDDENNPTTAVMLNRENMVVKHVLKAL